MNVRLTRCLAGLWVATILAGTPAAVGQAPQKTAVDEYKRRLKSADMKVQIESTRLLLEAGEWDNAIPGILKQGLKDETHQTSAFYLTGRIGPKAKELLPDLLAAVEKGRGNPRLHQQAAALAFRAVGPSAVKDLIQMAEIEPSKYDPLVVTLIGGIGEPAVKPVSEMLPKVLPELRLLLLRALGDSGAKSAAGVLIPYLRPEAPARERYVAFGCIARLGYQGKDAAPEIRKMLNDESEQTRFQALQSYIRIFPSGAAVREVATAAIKDQELQVRFLAAETLLWLNPNPGLLAPGFPELVKNESLSGDFWIEYAELNAVDCLALLPLSLGAAKKTPRIREVLTLVAKHSRKLKDKLGPHRETLGEAIEAVLKDKDWDADLRPERAWMVGEIAWALGTHEDRAIRALTETLDKDLKPQKPTSYDGRHVVEITRVLDILGRFGPKAKAALPLVEERALQLSGAFVNYGAVAHVAICRIDPTQKATILSEIPVNEFTVAHRLAIDPKDKRALKAITESLEAGERSTRLYTGLHALEPPPEALRASLEKAVELFGKTPAPKPGDPFRPGSPELYRIWAAHTLWKITGDPKPSVAVLSEALKHGQVRPSEVSDLAHKMGSDARELIPELLRFELNQPYPSPKLLRMVFFLDRDTALKVDLTR